MKDKKIKERYNNAINSFKSRIDSNDTQLILNIENIEHEFDEYNQNIVKDKINLGVCILSGLALISVGLGISSIEISDSILNTIKNLSLVLVSGLGIISIPSSINSYKRERFYSNIEANKSLEAYENMLLQTNDEAKVNVKKR